MGVSIPPMSSRTSALSMAFANNLPFLTTPSRMGLLRGRTKAIVEAARAMLHDQGLPLFLWTEACRTTVYRQNRSPHKAVAVGLLRRPLLALGLISDT